MPWTGRCASEILALASGAKISPAAVNDLDGGGGGDDGIMGVAVRTRSTQVHNTAVRSNGKYSSRYIQIQSCRRPPFRRKSLMQITACLLVIFFSVAMPSSQVVFAMSDHRNHRHLIKSPHVADLTYIGENKRQPRTRGALLSYTLLPCYVGPTLLTTK